jgi:hypothetical protein
MVDGCVSAPRAGAVCQKQHWPSHKRQCRDLAHAELRSIRERHTTRGLNRILKDPDVSELPFLLKLSAITWIVRPHRDYSNWHLCTLIIRKALLEQRRPAPGDSEELLVRLLKRATRELPWPQLPADTEEMFDTCFRALTFIGQMGEPEAAVEILSRHVDDIERRVVAPNFMAQYYICRLDWLLAAAWKFDEDEGKRGAYVAEAKGLVGRATRSLRSLRSRDFDILVSESTSLFSSW